MQNAIVSEIVKMRSLSLKVLQKWKKCERYKCQLSVLHDYKVNSKISTKFAYNSTTSADYADVIKLTYYTVLPSSPDTLQAILDRFEFMI